MTDSEADYSGDAGLVKFPRAVDDLLSTTHCPACFEPLLTSLVCANCRLDLGHPYAGMLAGVSTRTAGLIAERRSLIGRIRYDTRIAEQKSRRAADAAAEAGRRPMAPPTAPPVAPLAPWPVASTMVPVEFAVPPAPPAPRLSPAPAAPAVPTPPPAPRRSSVQVLLLIVGISLVSVAAIFFLLYALTTYGIVGRSIVIGTVTVTAFAVASLLRRRRLTATAEGIAVFAVVLVYLDVFAVRANNLFGSGDSDPLLYWGVALMLSSVGFVVWNRASRLRVANIVAFAVFAPGAGLVAGALADPLESTTRLFLAFLAVGLAGLVHPLADRLSVDGRPRVAERSASFVVACGGLLLSFVTAFFVEPQLDLAVLVALAAVAAVSAAHAAIAVRVSAGAPLLHGAGPGFGALGGLSLATGVAVAAYRALPNGPAMIVAAAATAVMLFVLLAVARRAPGGAGTGTERAAAIAVAVVAAAALLPPLVQGFTLASRVPLEALSGAWRSAPADTLLRISAGDASSVVALAAVLLLGAGYAAATRQFARYRTALIWSCSAVLLLAIPLLATAWAVTAGFLVAAAGCSALLLARGRIPAPAAPALAVTAAVGAALGYSASWASTGTWLAGSLGAIALVLLGRRVATAALPSTGPVASTRAGLLALATLLGIAAAAALAHQPAFDLGLVVPATAALDPLRAVSILAVALLGLAAVPQTRRLLSELDRHTLFGISLVAAGIAAPSAWVLLAVGPAAHPLLPEPLTSLLLSLATVAALLAWLVPAANSDFPVERIACAIAAAPTAFWVLDSAARLSDLAPNIRSLPGLVAAVLVAAVGLAVAARRPHTVPRWSLDFGVACTGALGLLVTVGSGLEWLALLLAGVATLLTALAPDGLVGAYGSRKHLGWLALALATAALWWRLSADSVDAVEAYVLPVAGVLLLVALLAWRGVRSVDSAPAHTAPSLIALGALLVALVPVGVAGASGPPARALVVGGVSTLLLIAGSWLQGADARRRWLDTLALAGTGGVLAAAVPRGTVAFLTGRADDASADAWIAALFAVLVVAAIGQTRLRGPDSANRAALGTVVLVAGMAIVFLFELAGLAHPLLGAPRAVASVVLFSAIALIAVVVDRPPVPRLAGWVALGLAAVTAFTGLTSVPTVPVELLSLPIALALLGGGGVLLARDPALRSWPALVAGLGVLLLPSLLLAGGDRPVWRLVAVGVVALVVFALGVRLRLQAPTLIGAVVVLVHAATTFAPQIRAVYELTEWWVWAGIGGIPIIVYAALAERSVRTTKSFVLTIGSLR